MDEGSVTENSSQIRPKPVTRIYLELPPRLSGKRLRYTVRLHSPDGEILVRNSLLPFCDSARALLASDIRGELEMWDAVRPYPRMKGPIEIAARLTLREDEATGQFVLWRPFPAARQRSKTVDRLTKVSEPTQTKAAVGIARAVP